MSERNPWKCLSSRIVYDNDYVSLREDEVVNPDGSLGVYAGYNIRYAIAIVAIDEGGDLFLVG